MTRNTDSCQYSAGNRSSTGRIVTWGMTLFTLITIGMFLFRPFLDPDFYWHLKTGEWIWQNRTLPDMDPFGVPPLPDPSPRNSFILTSYWLIQLIMYAFYSCIGMPGIIFFRWVVAGISLLVCMYWTNVRNSSVIAVLAIGAIQILELYFIERPQFISFVCFGALLVILFRLMEQSDDEPLWRTLVPLSFVMINWANMHGGFIIGQAILIYCVVAEGIKFSHSSLKPLSSRNYMILLISSIAALLASCINPNVINSFRYLPIIFDGNNYANKDILEQLSIVEYYKETHDGIIFLYLSSVVLTCGAVCLSKHRKNITWIGILAGSAFMGCQHMRLMPFFLVSSMVFMSKYFETECFAKKGRVILIAVLIVTAVYCISDEFPRVSQAAKSGWVPFNHFPVKSADFIAANNISGSVFTSLYWGGYMVWRLGGPVNKIFHDGRFLSIQRAWEYNNSRVVGQNQRPYWKGLLKMRDIRIVVLPINDDNGKPDTLTQSIYADTGWSAVYTDGNEVVFVRNEQVVQ